MTIVTRFAPSPTGYLHIGGLRTLLYSYLFAKKNNGKMILRIEDTDRERYVEGSIENLIHILNKIGLKPDEGPNNPGNVGPYLQSERLDIYKKYIDELVKNEHAYYCFCDSSRLEKLREEQQSMNLPTKYDGTCRFLTKDEVQKRINSKEKYTIRIKIPKNIDIEFEDIVKGKITINTKDVDDQIILKSDGFPTYHSAVVIDDHLMGITHIIRGDEWISSTPKHILLYNFFGWKIPKFCHLPLILGNDKKKLSKRTGDVAIEKYLAKGYLVEALINYISLLGWNPKTTEEFFSLDELIKRFELEQIHRAGAIFDVDRLDYVNTHYIKNLDENKLYTIYIEYLGKYDKEFLEKINGFSNDYNKKICFELKTRIKKFEDYKGLTGFFYNEIANYRLDLFLNEKMKINSFDIVKKTLQLALDILSANNFNSIDEIRHIFVEKIKENGMKNGEVLWPVRVALSAEEFSPGALELIFILGNKKSSERIEKVLKLI